MVTARLLTLAMFLPILVHGQEEQLFADIEDKDVLVSLSNEGYLWQVDGKRGRPTDGLIGEGWGAGVRKGSRFIDECGAGSNEGFIDDGSPPPPEDLIVERFRGKNGGKTADSRVICGVKQSLRVRHQARSARRRNGCAGAYEIKVTVENRACHSLPSVVYRRVTDFDVGSIWNLWTVQGVDAKKPKVVAATTNPFCGYLPSGKCPAPEDTAGFVAVPASKAGPADLGTTIDLDLGSLKKGERATFYLYYGAFKTPHDAQKCLRGARIDTHALATDPENQDTYLFGIRRSLSKGKASGKKQKCVRLF